VSLLLDSHVLVWWQDDDARLSERARQAIENPDALPHFSAASIWELAIKQAKGKLRLPATFMEAVRGEGFVEIPVSSSHALRAAALEPHHEDPFDRMLVAQAQSEGLTVVSRDTRIADYDVPVLW
jgi:PIN domain nuclease of toxin-antitoxin system